MYIKKSSLPILNYSSISAIIPTIYKIALTNYIKINIANNTKLYTDI